MKCKCCLQKKDENCFHEIELSLADEVLRKKVIKEVCTDCLDLEDVSVCLSNSSIKYLINNKPKYNKKMIKNLMGDDYDNYYYGYGQCVEALGEMGHELSISKMKDYTKRYILQNGFYTREKININAFETGEQFGWIYPKKEFHKFWDLRINGKFRSVKKSKIRFGPDKLEYLLDKGYYKKHKKENLFWVYVNTVDDYSFCDICGGKTKIEDFGKAVNNCWIWECGECRSKKNKEKYDNMSPEKKKEILKRVSEYSKTEAGKQANNKHKRKKWKQDPQYRFSRNLRKSLSENLKANGWSKKTKTYEYIGLTKEEFVEHIESQFEKGMSWHNWGFDGWHLDHRLPLSAAKTEEEAGMLWYYTNLQPMWGNENLAKSNKHCPKELAAFLEERKAAK